VIAKKAIGNWELRISSSAEIRENSLVLALFEVVSGDIHPSGTKGSRSPIVHSQYGGAKRVSG
jgi:hypothetical protein